MSRVLVALALSAVCATGASAQVLSTANGDVLVNRGNGFAQASAGQALNPGDRVMIGARGGDATVTYELTCIERVERGRVITVKSTNPCNQPGAQTQPAAPGTGVSPAMIAGGLALAAGAGVLIYFGTKDDDKPSSP